MSKKDKHQTYGKKLTVPEIITYCKEDLGIAFNIKSEEEASVFLSKHNYFFRLKQYAEFGEKTKSGKYTNVDFGHMVELSTIDMFFRKLILKMTIDFEHYLKVKIINDSQENPAMYKVILSRIYEFVCKENSYCLVKEKPDTVDQLSSDSSSGFSIYSPFSP
jgi:hypothetical protein